MVALPLIQWHLRWKFRQQFPWTVLYAMMVSGMADYNHPDHFFPVHHACRNIAKRPFSYASNRSILPGNCRVNYSFSTFIRKYIPGLG